MNRNIWEEHATQMIRQYGYTEALRIATLDRDRNSPGTASFAFHNATVKAMRLFATVGKID